MPNTFLKPETIARTGLGLLRRELILPRLVTRLGIEDFRGAKNDTVNVRVPARLTAREYEWRTHTNPMGDALMAATTTAPRTRSRRAKATPTQTAPAFAEAQVWVFTRRLGREGTMVAGVRRFEGDVCDQETLDEVGPTKTYRWKMQDLIRQVSVSAVVAPDARELQRRADLEAATEADIERRAQAEADEKARQRAEELDALVATGSFRLTADLRWCDGQIDSLRERRELIVEALAAPGIQPAGRR